MDRTQILSVAEVKTVLAGATRRAIRSTSAKLNLTIFCAVTGCGLRVSELCALQMRDLVVAGDRPAIYVRHGKGDKARVIPLNWDGKTFDVLRHWYNLRMEHGAKPNDPFLTSFRPGKVNQHLTRLVAAKRWKTVIKDLGAARVSQLSIHCGRHTWCSHSLAAGRTLVEIKDAAGHANVSTTSIYLHLLDNPNAKELYA